MSSKDHLSEDILDALQQWYVDQCDGDWEHEFGIKLATLDNPGWSLSIDLIGTSVENRTFKEISDLASESDWIHCKVEGQRFEGRCGPANLKRLIAVFLDWDTQES